MMAGVYFLPPLFNTGEAEWSESATTRLSALPMYFYFFKPNEVHKHLIPLVSLKYSSTTQGAGYLWVHRNKRVLYCVTDNSEIKLRDKTRISDNSDNSVKKSY